MLSTNFPIVASEPVFALTRRDLRAGDTVTIVRGIYAHREPRTAKIVRIRMETTGVFAVMDFDGIGGPAVVPVEWLAMPGATAKIEADAFNKEGR